jgi:zinc-ribbon domain
VDTCSHCGGPLPENATFCPSCGRRTDAPLEERDVPIDVQHAEPRYFGLGTPVFVFSAAVGLLLLGIVLAATGFVIPGAIAIVVSLCLVPAFLAGARRWPESPIARIGVSAADRVRDEAGVAVESISTWSRAGRDIARLRKQQFQLRRDRDAKIRQLGPAFYAGDGRADELKAEAKQLDERIAANERELQRTVAGARRHTRRERATVVATEIRKPEEVPEPATMVAAVADPPAEDEPLTREDAVPKPAPKRRQARSR